MLLVVQLVWVALLQRSDYFLLPVHTVLDRDVFMKGVDMGGRLFVARCRGGSWALWIKVRD